MTLTQWPRSPDAEWFRGYLAGIFDAEGSCSCGVLRIANTDEQIICRIEDGLQRFGFSSRLETTFAESGKTLWNVRLTGGLAERTRFFQTVDPAITRKRDFSGTAVKAKNPLKVMEIEPLGREIEMFDITTGTGDFIAEGVISHNCFARPTHRYLDLNPREDFEREIVVKVNLPEVLRAELRRPSWKGEHVALGTNTDPYQWVEGRYRITRGVWEEMLEARNPCSVLTKSPLLLRDHRPVQAARREGEVRGEPVDPDARSRGVEGERARDAEPPQADRGGGGTA